MDAESLKQVNEKLEKYLAEQAQGDGKLSSSTDEGPSLAADNPTKPEKKEADGKQNQSSHTELVSYSGKSTSVAAKALSNQEQEDDDDDEGCAGSPPPRLCTH